MYIRLAERGDIPRMIPILNQLDRVHIDLYPDRFQELPHGTRMPLHIVELMKNKAFQLWLATEPGEVWGIMALEYRERTGLTAVTEQYILVEMIVVADERRGEGIGKELMAHAEQLAREGNYNRLELKVYEKNESAMGWYQSLGFETIHRTLARDVKTDSTED